MDHNSELPRQYECPETPVNRRLIGAGEPAHVIAIFVTGVLPLTLTIEIDNNASERALHSVVLGPNYVDLGYALAPPATMSYIPTGAPPQSIL
jgi:hypothetical protein